MPTTGSPVRASTLRSLTSGSRTAPVAGPISVLRSVSAGYPSRVMTSLRPSVLREQLRGSWRILLKEISAFGMVGAIALVIDVSIFAWLSPHGALKAKALSTAVSTTFAYFGNRHLSFSHRARTSIGRETSFFFGINLVTLVISELIIGFFVYVLGYGHASGVVFVVNL